MGYPGRPCTVPGWLLGRPRSHMAHALPLATGARPWLRVTACMPFLSADPATAAWRHQQSVGAPAGRQAARSGLTIVCRSSDAGRAGRLPQPGGRVGSPGRVRQALPRGQRGALVGVAEQRGLGELRAHERAQPRPLCVQRGRRARLGCLPQQRHVLLAAREVQHVLRAGARQGQGLEIGFRN